MSFNRLSRKSSFKWSFLIMEKGECRCPAGTSFCTSVVFDLHKPLTKPFSLLSNRKLFSGDTSLFSTVQDIIISTVSLKLHLTKISE